MVNLQSINHKFCFEVFEVEKRNHVEYIARILFSYQPPFVAFVKG